MAHRFRARAARLFERLEPDGVTTLPIEVELWDGVVLAVGTYAMLDVMRKLPARDFERMGFEVYEEEGSRRYRGRRFPREVLLREDIPADANLFRDDAAPLSIWASLAVHKACRIARLTGVGFAWPDRPVVDVP